MSDGNFEARRKGLRETLLPLVTGRDRLNNGIALFFDSSAAMREQVDAFIAFERECCSSLEMSAAESFGKLRLEILGIDANAGIFAEINDQAARLEAPVRESGGWTCGAKTIGVSGALASLICCILPSGVAAVVGTKIAEPLGVLGSPLGILAGTLGIAGLL